MDPDRDPAPQTHHPRLCRFNAQTQHLRPYLRTQPLPVHAAPRPSNQIQLSGSFLWTRRPEPTLPALPADRDPAPGRRLSPLASPRHLPGAVRCGAARLGGAAGAGGAARSSRVRQGAAQPGCARPRRTEPYRAVPHRPLPPSGARRRRPRCPAPARSHPARVPRRSKGRSGTAGTRQRVTPAPGLPSTCWGAGGSVSVSRAAATPPAPQGRSAHGGGVFAQHGQVG